MPVAFRTGSKGLAANQAVLTISHTVPSGSDRALYVLAVAGNATDFLADATVAYGGVALTPLAPSLANASQSARVFRLLNPAVGTADLVITTSSATAFVQAYVVSLDGVDQTTPEGTLVSFANQYATTPRTASVSVLPGGLALDVIGARVANYTLTMDSAQTAVAAPTLAAIHSSAASYRADATAMTWTFSATNNVTQIVVPVNPAGGGGGAATAVTLAGPSGGVVGAPSSNFAVGADGLISGTLVVTPSDGGGGGTFSPTSVSLTSGSPTGTFTYTPGSAGAKTIAVTNNGGLTNPSSISYTATTGTTYGFDFHTAGGMIFGDLAGALTALTRQAAVGITARAYDASTGALVASSGVLTTDSAGRLPRWAHASLASATQYVIVFSRQSDGEVCSTRMTTT